MIIILYTAIFGFPPCLCSSVNLFGVLIATVSSRSRLRNILSPALNTLAVLLIAIASIRAQNMKPDDVLDIGRASAGSLPADYVEPGSFDQPNISYACLKQIQDLCFYYMQAY